MSGTNRLNAICPPWLYAVQAVYPLGFEKRTLHLLLGPDILFAYYTSNLVLILGLLAFSTGCPDSDNNDGQTDSSADGNADTAVDPTADTTTDTAAEATVDTTVEVTTDATVEVTVDTTADTVEPPELTVFRSNVDSTPYFGDLWPSAWASDDSLFFAWGDGTGQADCIPTFLSLIDTPPDGWEFETCGDGTFWLPDPCTGDCGQASFCRLNDCGSEHCYPLCSFASQGIRRDTGPVANLASCSANETGNPVVREDTCIVSLDPPDGDYQVDRKVSSLLVVADILIAHVHTPCCDAVTEGVLMINQAGTWTELRDSSYPGGTPWGADSHFRVGMFVQMGRNHELSEDSFIYMMGVDLEIGPGLQNQAVYLARVPVENIGGPGYGSWEYLTSDGSDYTFTSDQSLAVPVVGDLGTTTNPGGGTAAQGSAMYHAGLDIYLFITGMVDVGVGDDVNSLDGALYIAEEPWGPWVRFHTWPGAENHGGITSFIAKDAGPNCMYFAYAGLPEGTVLNYNRYIDRLVFNTPCGLPTDCGCGSTCVEGFCALTD